MSKNDKNNLRKIIRESFLNEFPREAPAEVRCNSCGWEGAHEDMSINTRNSQFGEGSIDDHVCPKCGEEEHIDELSENNTKIKEPEVKPVETPAKPSRRTIKVPHIKPGAQPIPKATKKGHFGLNERFAKRMDEYSRMQRILKEGPMNIDNEEGEEPESSLRAGIEGRADTPFSAIDLFKKGELDYTTLERLGSDEFNEVVRTISQVGKLSMNQLMTTFKMASGLEIPYRRELSELAKRTVQKLYGVPNELMNQITAELKNPGEVDAPEDDSDSPQEELIDDFTAEEQEIIKKNVDKRVISNALLMGSGYKTHSVLNNIKGELDRIDNRLFPLYVKLMPNFEFTLWKYPSDFSLAGRVVAGRSELEFEEQEEQQEEQQEEGVRQVSGAKAQAVLFPILLHEVAKSVTEYLFANGLPQHEERINREIMKQADSYTDEHWMKLIGPQLWRHLNNAIDYIIQEEGDDYSVVSFLLQEMAMLEPEEFISLIDDVLHNGESAVAKLRAMVQEIEEDVEEYRDETGEIPTPEDLNPDSVDNSSEIGKRVHGDIEDLLSNIDGNHEPSKDLSSMNIDELNDELSQALASEDYRMASKIRDEITNR